MPRAELNGVDAALPGAGGPALIRPDVGGEDTWAGVDRGASLANFK